MRREWTADEARTWLRILRDLLAAGIGSFILLWQCVFTVSPNALLIGAALALFGMPMALRLDRVAGSKDEE